MERPNIEKLKRVVVEGGDCFDYDFYLEGEVVANLSALLEYVEALEKKLEDLPDPYEFTGDER